MSKHLLYFLVINVLIILLLIWNSYVRFNNFKDYHITLAEESVKSLSNEVNGFIKEHQRLVTLFAENHRDLIKSLISDPEDEKLQSTMKKHLLAFFPNYFSFTIADQKGEPYLVDFDGHIGELCTNDIAEFAVSRKNTTQVHPGLDDYHFDIMTHLAIDNTDLIFYVNTGQFQYPPFFSIAKGLRVLS